MRSSRSNRTAAVLGWGLAVALGLGAGTLAVARLMPDPAPSAADGSMANGSTDGTAVVPVPGVDVGGDAETARVLLPAGTPALAPSDPGSAGRGADGWADARLRIPSLGLDAPVLDGVDLSSLASGVGHWPGTALPGDAGNMVLAGHRTTHSAPFRRLDELGEGDEVTVAFGGRTVAYRVVGTEVVTPDRLDVARPTEAPTATLFACHPPGSAAQRIVVRLEAAR